MLISTRLMLFLIIVATILSYLYTSVEAYIAFKDEELKKYNSPSSFKGSLQPVKLK